MPILVSKTAAYIPLGIFVVLVALLYVSGIALDWTQARRIPQSRYIELLSDLEADKRDLLSACWR